MNLGGRSLGTLLKAGFEKRHYVALLGMGQVYDHPIQMLERYLLRKGEYPFWASVKTPAGPIRIQLYSHHDLLTVNEIFCRKDYATEEPAQTVVDFGSNIGISALYFLTRGPQVKVKLFEPLPSNIERLKLTLRGYEDRYELYPVAVGLEDGEVEFGYEPSGRYGGIGVATPSSIRVPCRKASGVLSEIQSKPGFSKIDVLKIDIEGFEAKVVASLEPKVLTGIGHILAEIEHESPELPGFAKDRYGPIVRWKRGGSNEGRSG